MPGLWKVHLRRAPEIVEMLTIHQLHTWTPEYDLTADTYLQPSTNRGIASTENDYARSNAFKSSNTRSIQSHHQCRLERNKKSETEKVHHKHATIHPGVDHGREKQQPFVFVFKKDSHGNPGPRGLGRDLVLRFVLFITMTQLQPPPLNLRAVLDIIWAGRGSGKG